MYTFDVIIFLHIKNTNDLGKENTRILQKLSKHLFPPPSIEGEVFKSSIHWYFFIRLIISSYSFQGASKPQIKSRWSHSGMFL